jgi:cobalt-zinc-cadmium resistance protein CzcA
VNAEVNRIEREQSQRQLLGRLQQLEEEYLKGQKAIDYFEKTGLRQAEQIIFNAGKSLQAGEISYTEWILLTDQAVQIRLEHLEALHSLRNTKAEIIFLTGNQ